MPVKIYTDSTHFDASQRGELIDLLKPFWGKEEGFCDDKRVALYGISERDVIFVNKITDSCLAVLPMSWNYYIHYKKQHLAIRFVMAAQKAGKKVLSWMSGDFGVRIPHFDNLKVLRCSGYRSKLTNDHQGMPVFITDPLQRYYEQEALFLREKSEKPVIGFCGQSKGSLQKYTLDLLRTAFRNTQYHLKWRAEEPQDLYPSTLRRAKILQTIECNLNLQANFIKHEQYRAGAANEAERQRTAIEFYDNMIHSDYVVCVRGGGNFSVRLYETLAMGRIPIFINTDCLLPLANKIDWKAHVVWVEEREINQIGNKILAFHRSLSPSTFLQMQNANRALWVEKLKLGTFFKININLPMHVL